MKVIAKFIERAFWFFPITLLAAIIALTVMAIKETTVLNVSLVLFMIYLFPPLLYRFLSLFIPIKVGTQKWGPKESANGWMIAHRIQMIYMIVPFFEILI